MSRYIDADAIDIRAREGHCIDGVLYLPYRDIKKSLDSAPSKDIVFCKECKHASDNHKYGCKFIHFKYGNDWRMYAYDFCSRGERKESE